MNANDYIDNINLIDFIKKKGFEKDHKKSSRNQEVYCNGGEKILVLKHKVSGQLIYKNLYNSSDYGNIIHFVVNRLDGYLNTARKSKQDYARAFAELDNIQPNIKPYDGGEKKNKKVIFEYDLYKPVKLHDYSFLNSKGINTDILKHPLFNGQILNCYKYSFKTKSNYGVIMTAFPMIRDNKIVGLDMRKKDEKKMAFASEAVNSFWCSNYFKSHDNIFLTEQPIDNLSYFQIKGNTNSTHIASLGSISDAQCIKLLNLINSGVYRSLTLSNDNDLGGYRNDLKILSHFIEKENYFIETSDKNSVTINIKGKVIKLQNIDDFKRIVTQLIYSNNLQSVIFIEKSKANDWNDELNNVYS